MVVVLCLERIERLEKLTKGNKDGNTEIEPSKSDD